MSAPSPPRRAFTTVTAASCTRSWIRTVVYTRPSAQCQVPRACMDATIATEDASFYTNPGVDVWAIIRAVYINLKGGEVLAGGRHLHPAVRAQLVTFTSGAGSGQLDPQAARGHFGLAAGAAFSKDEIFTLYLNEAPTATWPMALRPPPHLFRQECRRT